MPDPLTDGAAVADLARRLAALAAAPGASADVAVAAIQVQRLAARILKDAVTVTRESGMSWRELSALLGVPSATLYRQYHSNDSLHLQSADWRAHATAPPVPATVPPAERPRGACPAPPDDLFAGRVQELADLPALFSRRRLVTLWGPPGVGKTRLALEFCDRRTGARWDRIVWVPVGAVAQVAEVAAAVDLSRLRAAIVAAAGVEAGMHDVLAALCRGGKPMLVLDGCEYLTSECAALVRELLDAHPKLTVLTTSREPLRLAGEVRFRVAPLPAVPTDPGDEWLSASPAVLVFADRVGEVAHDLNLAGHEREIAEICNAVDGLPLAIELAAHLCATIPIARLRAELAQRPALLDGTPHSGLTTDDGFQAAMSRSYTRLADGDRRLFRRLSIVPGGADHDTAAALVADLGLSGAALHHALGRLCRASLLAADETRPGWFRMLAPLRGFGRQLLDAERETDGVHELLFGRLAERADRLWTENFRDPHADLWNWAPGQLANMRYATALLRRAGRPPYPLLAAVSAQFLMHTARIDEAVAVLEQILAVPNLSIADEARALAVTAQGLVLRGHWPEAQQQLSRAHDLAESAGDEALALQILSSLIGTYPEAPDQAAEAATHARDLIGRLRACGDTELLATALFGAAWYLMAAGCDGEARDAVAEAVTLRAGRLTVDELQTAGVAALSAGAVATAIGYFIDGLRHSGHVYTSLDHIEGLALAAGHGDDQFRALCLLAGADAARAERRLANGAWWGGRLQAGAATARARLRPDEATAAAEMGSRMTMEQLTELALSNRIVPSVKTARPLNPRENQVATLIAEGHNNKQIAARLSVSVRTVEAHTTKIRSKLGLTSRAQIAHWVATYAVVGPR